MQPIKHPMCNDVLRKPAGMTEDECRDLHIRRDDSAVWSFWQPNPEELLALNRGGAVALIVMGATHPPLSIIATHPTEPQEPRTVDESEYRHRMEVVNGRLNKLLALSKQIVASWISTTEDSPKRRNLSDKFLDLINANRHDGSLVQPVHVEDEPGVTQADVERYRADADGWKAEAERWRKVAEEATATDGNRTFDAGGWMNECLNAEAALNTERELRKAAELNIDSLASYAAAIDGDHIVSGMAVEVRNVIQAMRQGLRLRGEEIERLREAADKEREKALAIGTIREKIQHLDDDRHWLEFNVEFTGWHNSTPEFFYRSGFNAAANAVLMMPELNPNAAEG